MMPPCEDCGVHFKPLYKADSLSWRLVAVIHCDKPASKCSCVYIHDDKAAMLCDCGRLCLINTFDEVGQCPCNE